MYGCRGAAKSSLCGAFLDERAGVHHLHALAHARDDAEVVRDEDEGRAAVGDEVAQEVEDLRLDRDVERRRRLVGDEELRLAGERHRDHHALAHAARELVRVVPQPVGRARDSDLIEKLDRASRRRLAVEVEVLLDRLPQLRPDGEDGVQARHRVLEDHRDLLAADPPPRALGEPEQLAPLELDAPRR